MSGTGINITHTHTVDCDEESCPLQPGEDIGREWE